MQQYLSNFWHFLERYTITKTLHKPLCSNNNLTETKPQ